MSSELPFSAPPSPEEAYLAAGSRSSLAALDQALGTTTHVQGDLDPLWGQWFQAVAHLPLEQLASDDLGRVLDGCLHLPVVLPVALARLGSSLEKGGDEVQADERLLLAVARAGRRLRRRVPDLAGRVSAFLETSRREAGASAAATALGPLFERAWAEWSRVEAVEQTSGWRDSSLMGGLPAAQRDQPVGPFVRSPFEAGSTPGS